MKREEKSQIVKMWEDKTGYAFLGDINDPDHFWVIYDEVMGTYNKEREE